MKRSLKIVAYCLFLVMTMGVYVNAVYAFSAGPPDGRTGSPADNFLTCNASGCHETFELNEGDATFSISAPDTFSLGETINVTVSFENSDTERHGFQLSALDVTGNHAGSFDSTDNNTQTGDGNFISHTLTGTEQTSWTVEWTAPSGSVEAPVTFYAAGNEANGNDLPTGDYIYTEQATINLEGTETPTTTPTVTPTPGGCEASFMGVLSSIGKLKLKQEESREVTIRVEGDEGCTSEGVTIEAEIKRGEDIVEISPDSAETDGNGEATFTLTAEDEKGKAKIKFKGEGLKAKLKVKVKN